MTTKCLFELNLEPGSYPEGDAGISLAEKPRLAKGYFSGDLYLVKSDL